MKALRQPNLARAPKYNGSSMAYEINLLSISIQIGCAILIWIVIYVQ